MPNRYSWLKSYTGTFPPPGKKAKAKKRRGESEAGLQQKCEDYLNLKGIRYIRLPDSLYSAVFNPHHNVHPKVRREVSKCIKGVPDLVIMVPYGIHNMCLLCELKTEAGKLSQDQKSWHKGLNVEIIRNFDEFKNVVDRFSCFVKGL